MDIRDFTTSSTDLLAYGEPTHLEPAFGRIRNELFADLAEHGFRSIALEIDRVAAFAVDDFVREGVGSIENVMRDGFSHFFGTLDTNRQLVAWMREYNKNRLPAERLAFHGFDAATEMTSAPSPRRYLEHARDYLGLDIDIATPAGDDVRWSRTEAVMDPAMSVGDTADADRLRVLADDMLTTLHARAPELVAKTSRAEWYRARTHLTAGIGLLRYHKQAAERVDENTRVSRLSAVRDVVMAENLIDIRQIEALRGPTLVFSQNRHLQRNVSRMALGPLDVEWFSAGSIVAAMIGERYTFVAGSLGRSAAIGLGEPEADTYEAALRQCVDGWGLVAAAGVAPARVRTDTTPRQGYFPLDQEILDAADAVLHVTEGDTSPPPRI